MEIYQLKSFQEIAKNGNLTKSADALHISQSALSTQLKQLENSLGVTLFTRSTRGMYLTDHGRILLSYANDIVEAANLMMRKSNELNGKVQETLKIGLNTDGQFLKASKLSRQLKSSFPDLTVMLMSSQTINTAEMLHRGLIDIGFFFGDGNDPQVVSEVISSFDIRIAIPKSFLSKETVLNWATLAKMPWILSTCDCPYNQIVLKEMTSLGLVPNHQFEASDESVVKDLLLDEQGVAVLREDDAEAVLTSGKIVLWEDARFQVALRLGQLKIHQENPLHKSVLELVKQLWQSP